MFWVEKDRNQTGWRQSRLLGWSLVFLSLLFLAVSQVFWLKREYEEQQNILQKEVDNLLQNAVHALEDSVIEQRLLLAEARLKKPLNHIDTLKTGPKSNVGPPRNPPSGPPDHRESKTAETVIVKRVRKGADTLFLHSNTLPGLRAHQPGKPVENGVRIMKFNQTGAIHDSLDGFGEAVSIILSHDSGGPLMKDKLAIGKLLKAVGNMNRKTVNGSGNDIPKKLIYTIKDSQRISMGAGPEPAAAAHHITIKATNQLGSEIGDQIMVSFFSDSLMLKDLREAYQMQLQKAGINLSLAFLRQREANSPSSNPIDSADFKTAEIAGTMPIGSLYQAFFFGHTQYLMRKILPQSLFSVFLLTITALAFGTIYRNMIRQQRLIRIKNDFISNVTHELKTPIATASVAIEALQNFGVASNPEQTREYLVITQSELYRLSLLVDKVLNMATYEEQGLVLRKEKLNLFEVVNQVLGSMRLQFEKQEISFTPLLSPPHGNGEEGWLMADRVHLSNVIFNLLDNAIKYSPKKATIRVHMEESPDRITLVVDDNGMGIAPEYQEKIFEKFFRVPMGNTHNVKGHGLGLNYVQSVVKQHGGQISLHSDPGKGTRFTVVLPKDLSLT